MTDAPDELERLIAKAKARGPMTPDETRRQRLSWVYGQLMDCAAHVTKAEVEQMIFPTTQLEEQDND